MKSEFMLAITQLAAEKKLPLEVVLDVVESALVSAFRKDTFGPNQEISVKLDPNTGKVSVLAEMTVVDTVTDSRCEVTPDQARVINPDVQVGDTVVIEATPGNAGRIAAQTAKQVVLQRLHEAEREIVFEEFADREGQIITGIVERAEPRQIVLDLGRTEGVLPASEQVRAERYRVGQRLKVAVVEVHRSAKGAQILVSRTHPNLLRGLLELEVPEIHSGVVELKSIAREAGNRSKIAVTARQQGVDAVGSCVGLRGIRIQNIVNELNGEKIDIVEWHPDQATFIANALSPAQVAAVELNEEEKAASVVVPDRQLSLAIGKEGQNARLAAKLTGWRIDIKSVSVAETERAALAQEALQYEEAVAVEEAPVAEAVAEEAVTDEVVAEEAGVGEAGVAEEQVEAVAETAEEPEAAVQAEEAVEEESELGLEEPLLEEEEEEEVEEEVAEPAPAEEPVKAAPLIRFAEDILPERRGRSGRKPRKGKAKVETKEKAAPATKAKKARRPAPVVEEDEESGQW